MKLKPIITTAVLCLATSAFAQWFPARVQVTVLPGQIAVQVFNPFYEPLVCSGQVFGQTIHGPVFTTFFAEQVMQIGAARFAYVLTAPDAPFLTGWANIHCRYARWW